MTSSQIIMDLETQRTFDEVEGRQPELLGVSLVGIYHYGSDRYEAYRESEIKRLEETLAGCSRIIGFNIRRFDMPVLQPYLPLLNLSKLPMLDLLEDLHKTLGHRVSLASVAGATLEAKKLGSGLDAIDYYRSGDFESLEKYCLQDVRLTKEVYEFGKRFGHVYYFSKSGETRLEVKVNWQDPDPPPNLSLF